uniref:Uncharacterized protein n=1 Tax=Daphnia magna TaxID=35525 RepID=A0A0P5XAJ9_9CRUS
MRTGHFSRNNFSPANSFFLFLVPNKITNHFPIKQCSGKGGPHARARNVLY